MSSDAQKSQPEPMTCEMCGYRFDPAQNVACGSCPMHRGCALVCCPACGYSSVDPRRSRLVGLGSWIAARLRLPKRTIRPQTGALTLADVPPGSRVRIEALDGLSTGRCHQMQAYGLAPGRWVKVVQQSPVTVVRVEHLDLAFESAIAHGIRVETTAIDSDKRVRTTRMTD